MNKFISIVILFTFTVSLQAIETINSVINSDGDLDNKYIQKFIDQTKPYIKEYPPRFKSKEHQEITISTTKNIIKEFKSTDLSTLNDANLLTNIALIYSMAHNLDLGTARNAKITFEKALSIDENNKKTNYLYGMFLISTSKYHFESEKYLQKALELGERDSLFSLALLQLQKGNKEKGLNMLEEYSKDNPNNNHVKKVIEAVKNGEIKFEKSKTS